MTIRGELGIKRGCWWQAFVSARQLPTYMDGLNTSPPPKWNWRINVKTIQSIYWGWTAERSCTIPVCFLYPISKLGIPPAPCFRWLNCWCGMVIGLSVQNQTTMPVRQLSYRSVVVKRVHWLTMVSMGLKKRKLSFLFNKLENAV